MVLTEKERAKVCPEMGYVVAVLECIKLLSEQKMDFLKAYTDRGVYFGLDEIPDRVSRGMSLIMSFYIDMHEMEMMLRREIGALTLDD